MHARTVKIPSVKWLTGDVLCFVRIRVVLVSFLGKLGALSAPSPLISLMAQHALIEQVRSPCFAACISNSLGDRLT